MASVVPINQVIPSTDRTSSRGSILKMVEVLKKQGQIEPLQVKVFSRDDYRMPTSYITFDADVHAPDIVSAAITLGWPTLLIAVVRKFEQ